MDTVMNYKTILARNVQALMDRNKALNSHAKIAKQCRRTARKISARTIGYLLDANDERQPKLDTIVAVGEAFKVMPWLLLMPDFDPDHPASGLIPSEKALEIARLIDARKPTDAQWEVYRSLFVKAVPDERLEDLRAPMGIEQPIKAREYERAAKRKR